MAPPPLEGNMSVYERLREEREHARKAQAAKRVRAKNSKARVQGWRSYREAARARIRFANSKEGLAIKKSWGEMKKNAS